MGTPALWTAFLLGVLAFIAIDLRVSRGRDITPRLAAGWTLVWVTLSLAFAGWLYLEAGTRAAGPFLTAYVIEYALSVDNLFVFVVIFGFFKVSTSAQHKLLYWGILGAFVLRGTLIALGTSLVARFEWVLYLFGAFLLFTAWKLLFGKGEGDDEAVDPEHNRIFQWARRVLPVSTGASGLRFVTREGGKLKVTPLFLVLLVVETSDLLFALDSIPAVLGISHDPFLVFSSNACAILGLRSLYFLVSSLIDKFRYLEKGLGVILAFVGVKLGLETWFHDWAQAHEGPVILVSLGFIAFVLLASVLASTFIPAPPDAANPPKAP